MTSIPPLFILCGMKEIKLYNTPSRREEIFKPLNPPKVSIYSCGPTVYGYQHIGNMRAYLCRDILRRTLRSFGYDVTYAMNITDVGHLTSDADAGEDKMQKAAEREQKDPYEIAKFYEDAFWVDCDKLNIERPDKLYHATKCIDGMIDFISALQEKGYTYTANGNVYFDVSKFPAYADFAGLRLDKQTENRVEEDPNKKNPFDFVLWFSNSKFKNQIMQWDSPFGRGFPGWHIECSVMASDAFGEHLDIHCGGVDHIPVHHTNEVAQSEARFGHKWVTEWFHNNFLNINKEKVSKSVGNTILISDLTAKGYNPLHFRYMCLTAHYRSMLDFTYESLDAAKNTYESLKMKVIELRKEAAVPEDLKAQQTYLDNFYGALADDLNTPVALSVIFDLLKSDLSATDKLSVLERMDDILALDIKNFKEKALTPEIQALLDERAKARADKDFKRSDDLRDRLLALGVTVKDSKEGQEVIFI